MFNKNKNNNNNTRNNNNNNNNNNTDAHPEFFTGGGESYSEAIYNLCLILIIMP